MKQRADELADKFIASMKWSQEASDWEKDLVLGNIRGFAILVQQELDLLQKVLPAIPLFESGQQVVIDHPRYHGPGTVSYDTGNRKRMVGVLLGNGNTWEYEVETVKLAPPSVEKPSAKNRVLAAKPNAYSHPNNDPCGIPWKIWIPEGDLRFDEVIGYGENPSEAWEDAAKRLGV